METYGFMGNDFRTFSQKIESAFKRNCGKEKLAAFKPAFKYDLSCVLQQGNAQLLQQRLIRSSQTTAHFLSKQKDPRIIPLAFLPGLSVEALQK
jgi:hypothetical protein